MDNLIQKINIKLNQNYCWQCSPINTLTCQMVLSPGLRSARASWAPAVQFRPWHIWCPPGGCLPQHGYMTCHSWRPLLVESFKLKDNGRVNLNRCTWEIAAALGLTMVTTGRTGTAAVSHLQSDDSLHVFSRFDLSFPCSLTSQPVVG